MEGLKDRSEEMVRDPRDEESEQAADEAVMSGAWEREAARWQAANEGEAEAEAREALSDLGGSEDATQEAWDELSDLARDGSESDK